MKSLTREQAAFWDRYLKTLPPARHPRHARVEAGFAGDKKVTDGLIRLYLDGRKTAGSSLAADFLSAREPLPKPGNYWIILDGRRHPRLIVRTDKVVLSIFKNIPKYVARAEGEGDLSVAHWKRVHRKAYSPFIARWGIERLDDARVVTEIFTLVFSVTAAEPARRESNGFSRSSAASIPTKKVTLASPFSARMRFFRGPPATANRQPRKISRVFCTIIQIKNAHSDSRDAQNTCSCFSVHGRLSVA